MRGKVAAMYAGLAAVTALAWVAALAAFASRPLLLGTAFLAFTLGLRHALDADHISAIDNVTRKLMQQGKRPFAAGLYFALGHSTIVVALTVVLALGAGAVRDKMPFLEGAGGLIGTIVSAAVLFAIAAVNVLVFLAVHDAFRRLRNGEPYDERSVEAYLAERGLLGRIFAPFMRLVTSSPQMYPLGLLFGLGFDTATEIGLLGIAAIEGSRGLPLYDILIFPLLFTAGMTLLDTTDGVLMVGAYGWAFVKPVRKLYYNLTMTFVSIAAAVAVGSIEVLGVAAMQLRLTGPVWDQLSVLSSNFGSLGIAIVGVFAASWATSLLLYKVRRYDDFPVRVAE